MTTRPTQSFAIVPAAGRSVRMGEPKLLLPWGEKTILEQVLSVCDSAAVGHTIVVAHRDDQELTKLARSAEAHVVIPEIPPPQMKASVQAALQFIESTFHPDPSDVWLLAPADVPTLSRRVIAELLESHDENDPAILVPIHESFRGHPVLLPWSFAKRVADLGPDQGINALVEAGPTRFLELGPEATPPDIDTPEDLYRRPKSS